MPRLIAWQYSLCLPFGKGFYTAAIAGAWRSIHSSQPSKPVFNRLETRTIAISGWMLRAFASATDA